MDTSQLDIRTLLLEKENEVLENKIRRFLQAQATNERLLQQLTSLSGHSDSTILLPESSIVEVTAPTIVTPFYQDLLDVKSRILRFSIREDDPIFTDDKELKKKYKYKPGFPASYLAQSGPRGRLTEAAFYSRAPEIFSWLHQEVEGDDAYDLQSIINKYTIDLKSVDAQDFGLCVDLKKFNDPDSRMADLFMLYFVEKSSQNTVPYLTFTCQGYLTKEEIIFKKDDDDTRVVEFKTYVKYNVPVLNKL